MLQSNGMLSLGVVVSIFVAGCGEKRQVADIEKTVAASGVLTFQGKPLENYQVIFHPKDKKRPASARTDADGKFQLGTNRPGDGAVPGSHQVTVTYAGPAVDPTPGDEFKAIPPAKIVIPEKYGNLELSGVTQEIPTGGDSNLKIDLK